MADPLHPVLRDLLFTLKSFSREDFERLYGMERGNGDVDDALFLWLEAGCPVEADSADDSPPDALFVAERKVRDAERGCARCLEIVGALLDVAIVDGGRLAIEVSAEMADDIAHVLAGKRAADDAWSAAATARRRQSGTRQGASGRVAEQRMGAWRVALDAEVLATAAAADLLSEVLVVTNNWGVACGTGRTVLLSAELVDRIGAAVEASDVARVATLAAIRSARAAS